MARLMLRLFSALALGALLALGACNKKALDSVEPVNLLDLLNANSEVRRGLTVNSSAMKQTMKYNVYLPPKFNPETSYPILYLLHGAGGTCNTWPKTYNMKMITDARR